MCRHKHWPRHAPPTSSICPPPAPHTPLCTTRNFGGQFYRKITPRGPGFNSARPYLSFLLSIKMFLLSLRVEVWTPPEAEARRAGAAEGRSEVSEEGMEGSLVEFAHHITSANRTLPSISDIFIIPVNFS